MNAHGKWIIIGALVAVATGILAWSSLGSSAPEARAPARSEPEARKGTPVPKRPAPARTTATESRSPAAPPPSAPTAAGEDAEALAAIESLVEAGDIGEARAAASRFYREHPDSELASRVERLTGAHRVPGRPR